MVTKRIKYNSLEVLEAKARSVHGDCYDYTNAVCDDATTVHSKITITCRVHGLFTQRINDHISHRAGCPNCAKNAPMDLAKFLDSARKVHGTRYDYSTVDWVGSVTTTKDKLTLICRKHGTFSQSADSHINKKQGCPSCKSSKGESTVANWLDVHHIHYKPEHRFSDCRNSSTNRTLPFDFWLPDHNTCIEFHGKQHYTAHLFDCRSNSVWTTEQRLKANAQLASSQFRDSLKVDYCASKYITLIVIPYDRIKFVGDILTTHLISQLSGKIPAILPH